MYSVFHDYDNDDVYLSSGGLNLFINANGTHLMHPLRTKGLPEVIQ